MAGFAFADNNFVGAGAGVVTSSNNMTISSKSLSVKAYSYRYKLSLDKLNKILVSNKIPTIPMHSVMPYKIEIVNANLINIDKSFSAEFDSGINGYSSCTVGGSPCQFSGDMMTNSGLHLSAIINFYLHASKNNISTNIETFDNYASVNKPLKIKTQLDNILGKTYVIISSQKSGNLYIGQVLLVQFGK